MKTKRILFKTSGILKCITGGAIFLFFVLGLCLLGTLKNFIVDNAESLNSLLDSIIAEDPEYKFLLDMSPEQIVDYLFGSVYVICAICTFFGLTSIASGVFTLIFVRKYNVWLRGRVGIKVLVTVLDCIFYVGLIAKVLSIVAIYLKDKPIEEIEV